MRTTASVAATLRTTLRSWRTTGLEPTMPPEQTIRPAVGASSVSLFRGGGGFRRRRGFTGRVRGLLLGNLFQLGLEFQVELFDGAMALGAFQGQHGDLGEGGQQIEVLRTIGDSLRAEDEDGDEPAFVDQWMSDFAAEKLQLSLGGGLAGDVAQTQVDNVAFSGRFDERATVANSVRGGVGPESRRDGKGAVLAAKETEPHHSHEFRGGVEQPLGQGGRVHQLLDGLAQLMEGAIQLRFVARKAAIEGFFETGAGHVQDHHEDEGGGAHGQGLGQLGAGDDLVENQGAEKHHGVIKQGGQEADEEVADAGGEDLVQLHEPIAGDADGEGAGKAHRSAEHRPGGVAGPKSIGVPGGQVQGVANGHQRQQSAEHDPFDLVALGQIRHGAEAVNE